MARKTKKDNIHDFTRQIHSTKRTQIYGYSPLPNWNEKEAKENNRVACRDCRYFLGWNGCSQYLGRWHKPCEDFEWD